MYSIGQFVGIGTQLEVIVDPFGMECGPLGMPFLSVLLHSSITSCLSCRERHWVRGIP